MPLPALLFRLIGHVQYVFSYFTLLILVLYSKLCHKGKKEKSIIPNLLQEETSYSFQRKSMCHKRLRNIEEYLTFNKQIHCFPVLPSPSQSPSHKNKQAPFRMPAVLILQPVSPVGLLLLQSIFLQRLQIVRQCFFLIIEIRIDIHKRCIRYAGNFIRHDKT